MENISIGERDINSERVMEMTPNVVLTEKTSITVPTNYHALIIADDKVAAEVKVCLKKNLLRIVGGELLGKSISALYVSNRQFTSMSWGIGSLPIIYPFLGNARLNVGANGTLVPSLSDEYAFYKVFDKDDGILNLTECASAITSAFRKCASEVLVGLFNEAEQPIFETDFLVSEMQRRLNKRYCRKKLDEVMDGVMFRTATVSSIKVNEEDRKAVIEKYGSRKKKQI